MLRLVEEADGKTACFILENPADGRNLFPAINRKRAAGFPSCSRKCDLESWAGQKPEHRKFLPPCPGREERKGGGGPAGFFHRKVTVKQRGAGFVPLLALLFLPYILPECQFRFRKPSGCVLLSFLSAPAAFAALHVLFSLFSGR